MKYINCILIVILSGGVQYLQAQTANGTPPPQSNAKIYGNLYHQHHDFFGKAFSFQGLEAGLLTSPNVYFGVYGSGFANNLKTEVNNRQKYVWIGQYGVNGGYVLHEHKRVHPGAELKIGVFSLSSDEQKFGFFKFKRAAYHLNGLVMSPQAFGELNVLKWFRIRLGLSYNWYYFKDKTSVKPADLNHVSFSFGMLFLFKG